MENVQEEQFQVNSTGADNIMSYNKNDTKTKNSCRA